MKRILCVVVVALLSSQVGAKDSMEPSSATSFDAVALLVATNAQGNVSHVTFKTASSVYEIATNGMDHGTLMGLLKLNDKPVNLKGEVSMVGQKLIVKLIGGVKDMTPSLSGMSMGVGSDSKTGLITTAKVTTADGKFTYELALDKLTPDAVKGLAKWNRKIVHIEGDISQSRMRITLTGAIREDKAAGGAAGGAAGNKKTPLQGAKKIGK